MTEAANDHMGWYAIERSDGSGIKVMCLYHGIAQMALKIDEIISVRLVTFGPNLKEK